MLMNTSNAPEQLQAAHLIESSLDFSELSEEIEAQGGNLAGKPVASVFVSSRHPS